MLLCVDIGNTNIVLGAYDDDKLQFVARCVTDKKRTADQYAVELCAILALHSCGRDVFDGAIISSVVPPLLPAIKEAIRIALGCKAMTVSPGVKTGLNIKIDNPAILGSDLVCGAVAAITAYKPPCVLIDMGTATKISGIDKFGSFVGCSILPGIGISLDALSSGTAQLPHIEFDTASNIIGTNTIDSMRSGVVFGTASMIDGMIRKYRSVLGEDATVIATGGFSSVIIPFCETQINVDPYLVLDGLRTIYYKNIG